MNGQSQFMKAMSYGTLKQKIDRYSLTVEQIEEMDAAHERGEISEIENSLPSLADLKRKAGWYGKMAYEHMLYTNFPKFMRMYSDFTLWEALAELPEKIEAFKDEMWAAYERPQTNDPIERISHRRMYESMIEERVFEEIIKPFCAGE